MYKGEARYELIAETKSRLNIPVWVNGDITSPQKAAAVLKQTAADGIMIGRGAQGRPWFFRDLKHYAEHGVLPPALSLAECRAAILNHIRAMHAFYGETVGVRIARKHIGWYIGEMPDGEQARREINRLDNAAAQYDTLAGYLERLAGKTDRWACGYREG
ncbi:tRNA-dihydrouridine synthase B [Neisseria gonorrhoeae]|nr:tRNA-dihydrouridine synthase B [Neisseria gonorrhoeae]CNQ01119.1 tRNA-dihydrouridine synthase B [Neisseria gonorrhoeae]